MLSLQLEQAVNIVMNVAVTVLCPNLAVPFEADEVAWHRMHVTDFAMQGLLPEVDVSNHHGSN
jgi:hypothetical protein